MKRLWREQAEQWRAIKEWIDNSIAFCTVSGIDSRQPNFEIVASVIGAAAEMDRKETAFRTRRGLKGKALSGAPTGGRAFGYTSKNEPVETEATVVREIFERRANGESLRAIARDLNARAVPTPRGRRWHVSALHELTRNERYLGRLIYGQSQWIRSARNGKKRRRMEVPREQWVITDRPDLRLVPDEIWQRVRARDALPTGHHNARPKYPLSGLLLCAECGRPMTLCGGTNSQGYGSQRYICPNYREHAGCSNDMSVSRTVAEEFLIEPFRERPLEDQNFLAALSAFQNSDPKKSSRVACAIRGARANRISGPHPWQAADWLAPGTDGHDGTGGLPSPDALLASKLAAIESAAAVGALTQREAASRCAALRAEHERWASADVPTDEASLLANAGHLRAALVSAATDALRDALRRTLGTVRLTPVTDDGPRYLNATFEGGDMALLEWLALGDKASQVCVGSGGRI